MILGVIASSRLVVVDNDIYPELDPASTINESSGLTAWSLIANSTLDAYTGETHNGTYSARIIATANNSAKWRLEVGEVTLGQTVDIDVWVYNGQGAYNNIRAGIDDSAAGISADVFYTLTETGDWQNYTVQWVCDEEGLFYFEVAAIRTTGGVIGDWMLLDDCKVKVTPIHKLEFDATLTTASAGTLTNVIGSAWTVVRDDISSHVSPQETMVNVAVNVPSVDYDKGYARVLVGTATTNITPWTERFDRYGGTPTNMTNTAVTDMRSGSTATKFSKTATGSLAKVYRYNFGPTVDGVSYRVAFWARLAAGTPTVASDIEVTVYGTGDSALSQIGLEITSVWKRFEMPETYTAASTGQCLMECRISAAADGVEYEIWAPNMTTGTSIQPYIQETSGSTSTTRAADVITNTVPAEAYRMIEWIDGVEQPELSLIPTTPITMKNGTTKIFIDATVVPYALNNNNFVTDPNDLTSANWLGGTVASGSTTTGPDGTTTVDYLTFDDDVVYQDTVPADGPEYAIDLWIKGNQSGTIGLRRFDLVDDDIILTTSWQRLTISTNDMTNGYGGDMRILLDGRVSYGYTGNTGLQIAVFNAQLYIDD